jgi:hypothetical protein
MGFTVRNNGTSRWPNGIVPFEIDPASFPPRSGALQQVVLAINAWNNNSIIRLVPHTPGSGGDFARFVNGPACNTRVGRQGTGQQLITCVSGAPAGNIMHEIGHCLGLIHEHQRPDRGNFVAVNNANIIPAQFSNFPIDTFNCPVGSYDCGSIMHYGTTAFSVNGQPTITVTNPAVCPNIGQRNALSGGDLAAVRAMYESIQTLHNVTFGDTSDASPAVAAHDGKLFLAWKGSGNDNLNVMLSEDAGATFHGKHTSPETSSDSPALASHNGQLFIAWKGSGNENLNVATVRRARDTNGNEKIDGINPPTILSEFSDNNPAIASHNGQLFIAWKGSGNDNLNLAVSTDNGRSFHGTKTFGDTSSDSPGLASYDGQLYLAWKGSGNENLNVAAIDLGPNPGNPQINGLVNKLTFTDTSELGPALVAQGGLLFISWKGAGNDNLNLMFPADFRNCTVKFNSPETSSDAPAVTAQGNQLWMAWKGSGNDNLNVAQAVFSGQVSGDPVPSPLRRHSGNFIQSAIGLQGDFELVVPNGKKVLHYFRDNDTAGFPWHGPVVVHDFTTTGGAIAPIPVAPTGVSLIESNFNQPGNLELVVRLSPTLGEDSLAFFFFDANGWHGPSGINADGTAITVTGNPAFIQSGFGQQGNFEMIVPRGKQVVHYFRDNDAPGLPWHGPFLVHDFTAAANGAVAPIPVAPTGVALLESNFSQPGNLELMVRLTPTLGEDSLVFFYRDAQGWHGPLPVVADGTAVTGVTGDPAFLQSAFGKQGNFEMIVPKGKQVVHYFRDNDAPGLPWHGPFLVHDFTTGANGVIAPIPVAPTKVALLESNFGQPGNLELIVRLTPTLGEDSLVFFYRDAQGWHGPFPLVADGAPVQAAAAGSAAIP